MRFSGIFCVSFVENSKYICYIYLCVVDNQQFRLKIEYENIVLEGIR